MWGLNKRLDELQKRGKPIRVGIVGIGQMGRGLVSQMALMQGMAPAMIVDLDRELAEQAYKNAGILDYIVADNFEQAESAMVQGKYVVASCASWVCQSKLLDAVVDATGIPEVGAGIALEAIQNKKHIVMLNVETDIVIGVLLKKKADEAGVVYTGSAGDEPGAVMELYDFAKGLGFDVKAFGKGKNNPLDHSANPDTVREEAIRKKMNPKMLASFKDGTKTMVEMTAMCNATGFLPDKMGGHGPVANVSELPSIFSLKEEGGILNRYGTVDYVNGIAPGVYVIISSPLDTVREELQYLSMGEGPNYVLYRPYHLTSLETPLSVALAVLDHQATIAPLDRPYAETVAIAKKDLEEGEMLDGIGGYTVYGSICTYEEARNNGFLPIALIHSKVKMKQNVKKGQPITYDMVLMDEDSLLYQLRKEQDRLMEHS